MAAHSSFNTNSIHAQPTTACDYISFDFSLEAFGIVIILRLLSVAYRCKLPLSHALCLIWVPKHCYQQFGFAGALEKPKMWRGSGRGECGKEER